MGPSPRVPSLSGAVLLPAGVEEPISTQPGHTPLTSHQGTKLLPSSTLGSVPLKRHTYMHTLSCSAITLHFTRSHIKPLRSGEQHLGKGAGRSRLTSCFSFPSSKTSFPVDLEEEEPSWGCAPPWAPTSVCGAGSHHE